MSAQAELLLYCNQVRVATTSASGIVVDSTTSSISSRDGKSFRSIVDKLQRQSIRLSQIQDIEGCRCVVDGVVEQDALYRRLAAKFPDVKIDDLRKEASNGYRAVHLIPKIDGERYEIQIRSRLQHQWAQAVEVIADATGDPAFKYGGGDLDLHARLKALSVEIDLLERIEKTAFKIIAAYEDRPTDSDEDDGESWLRANTEANDFRTSMEWSDVFSGLDFVSNPYEIAGAVGKLQKGTSEKLAELIGTFGREF